MLKNYVKVYILYIYIYIYSIFEIYMYCNKVIKYRRPYLLISRKSLCLSINVMQSGTSKRDH